MKQRLAWPLHKDCRQNLDSVLYILLKDEIVVILIVYRLARNIKRDM